MDSEDRESFVEILASLRKKLAELESERDLLKASVEEDNITIKKLKSDKKVLSEEFKQKHALYNSMPAYSNQKHVRSLRNTVEILQKQYQELQSSIENQKEENAVLADSLLDVSDFDDRKKSINFVRQSLLSELHELVSRQMPADVILKKEKQIQMCDSLA